MFIKLTDDEGLRVWVNFKNVVALTVADPSKEKIVTAILFVGNTPTLHVEESVSEIAAVLQDLGLVPTSQTVQ